jgi:RNA polymerase sigma factor (TIGR02999 family)
LTTTKGVSVDRPSPATHRVTQLLVDWSGGNKAALDQLMPLVYEDLRRLARRYMRREGSGHTLQTTGLVNEAYQRLVDQKQVRWQNRAHFFGIAAQLMRRILVDHARTRQRAKRGGGALQVSLAEAGAIAQESPTDLLALDEALARLAEVDGRKSQIVELRFFGGLSIKETAEVLQVSPGTVMRDWTMAKAWLYRALNDDL